MYNKIAPYQASIDNVHQKGLWHQTFACWLINKEKNIIYIQLRGSKNRIGPNTFDASASGHLMSGETPEDGFRELTEELGKNIILSDKQFLGVFRNIYTSHNYKNYEFCNVFMANTQSVLTDFNLQIGEVYGIFELNINDAILLFFDKKQYVDIDGKIFENNKYTKDTRKISQKDFNLYKERVFISGYYLKIMIMAQRYVNNIFPIRI
ncbi:MAG: NUDIX hydrolase [Bdellovibrionota bacterium]